MYTLVNKSCKKSSILDGFQTESGFESDQTIRIRNYTSQYVFPLQMETHLLEECSTAQTIIIQRYIRTFLIPSAGQIRSFASIHPSVIPPAA